MTSSDSGPRRPRPGWVDGDEPHSCSTLGDIISADHYGTWKIDAELHGWRADLESAKLRAEDEAINLLVELADALGMALVDKEQAE